MVIRDSLVVLFVVFFWIMVRVKLLGSVDDHTKVLRLSRGLLVSFM